MLLARGSVTEDSELSGQVRSSNPKQPVELVGQASLGATPPPPGALAGVGPTTGRTPTVSQPPRQRSCGSALLRYNDRPAECRRCGGSFAPRRRRRAGCSLRHPQPESPRASGSAQKMAFSCVTPGNSAAPRFAKVPTVLAARQPYQRTHSCRVRLGYGLALLHAVVAVRMLWGALGGAGGMVEVWLRIGRTAPLGEVSRRWTSQLGGKRSIACPAPIAFKSSSRRAGRLP